jgi:hypothetical protein
MKSAIRISRSGGESIVMDSEEKIDHLNIRRDLTVAVGCFCDCKVWSRGGWNIVFCGLESDTIFAQWLLDTLTKYVERALMDHLANTAKPGHPRVRRVESKGFIAGCTARISARLNDLAHQSRGVGNGRSLVVAKNALIDEKLAQESIHLRKKKLRTTRVDTSSYRAGQNAGNRATFERPINGGSSRPLAIGHR